MLNERTNEWMDESVNQERKTGRILAVSDNYRKLREVI
jgi:hypothetical protein